MPFTSDRLESVVSECGTVRGRWLGTVFTEDDGRIWLPTCHLHEVGRGAVAPETWYNWTRKSCPDLDPDINAGLIRSVVIRAPSEVRGKPLTGTPRWRVWLKEDVDRIVGRRSDPQSRKADPAGLGRWIDRHIFQLTRDVERLKLRKGELLFADPKLTADSGTRAEMTSYWRQHRHPALDQDVNGGRLRALRVAKLKRTARDNSERGPQKIWVSSQADWEAITAWSQDLRRAVGSGSGETAADLARCLGLSRDRMDRLHLSCVLRRYREEARSAALRSVIWVGDLKRPMRSWRYDRAEFLRWLGGRDVSSWGATLCREVTPAREQRRERRLQKAVAFLQFVLTHGRYTARGFRRFLVDPPKGIELKPVRAGVSLRDIRRWAKAERLVYKAERVGRLTIQGVLRLAARALGVERIRKVGVPVFWRLPGPVVIPVSVRDATQQTTADLTHVVNSEPPPSRRGRGRPPGKRSELHAKVVAAWDSGRYGEKISALAAEFDLDRSTVSKILKGAGRRP